VQSTSETPQGPLQLDIYPGEDCHGELYLDDGLSIAGPSLRQTIGCAATARGVSLRFGAREGSFRPWWKAIAVTIHGSRPAHKIIADQPGPATIQISSR